MIGCGFVYVLKRDKKWGGQRNSIVGMAFALRMANPVSVHPALIPVQSQE